MHDLSVGDWIDLTALGLVLLGVARGFVRGPLREVLSGLSGIVSIVAAASLARPVYFWSGFDFGFHAESVALVIWFFSLLFGFGCLFVMADHLVRKITKNTGGLGLGRRSWGGGIGGFKATVWLVCGALFVAALPLDMLGEHLSVAREVRDSRTLRFARSNRWIVDWIVRTNLVGDLRAFLLEQTSGAMVDNLVPSDDPELLEKSRFALESILEDTRRLEHLGRSETARQAATELETNPEFAAFLRSGSVAAEIDTGGRFSLGHVKAILQNPENRRALAHLLEQERFRAQLLAIDLDAIRHEVDAGQADLAPRAE